MYVQLKKLMASKYSSSLCGGYIAVSNLNTKVWGFCFFFSSSFLFTVCVALRMFLWTNRAVFFPNDLKCTNAAKVWGCRNLEKIIYMEMGNLLSISLIVLPAVLYLCLKNDFVSSGWKKCKEYLAFSFENDNIWVLDFEIRSLNIKKL